MITAFLNVLKPTGMTSFAVVARVRRIAGTRRVGHMGTLDPMAEGVLPLAIGAATRLIEYVGGDKRYTAEVTLGVRTDSLDATGAVVQTADASGVDEAAIREALAVIASRTEQIPPMASALHHEGRRLYELFREGRQVDVPPRPVRIDAIDLVSFEGDKATIDVRCGPGTYIRSIARDLGEELRCGAHLSALVRTRRGPFLHADGVTLERLQEEGVSPHLLPPRRVVDGLRWIDVDEGAAATVRHGGRIDMPRLEDMKGLCALADRRGNLLAIARLEAGSIQPVKVFQAEQAEGEST